MIGPPVLPGPYLLRHSATHGPLVILSFPTIEVPVFFRLQTVLRPSGLFHNIPYGVIADACSILGALGMSQPGRRLLFFT
jgi:hypothetical protein